jgi:hypothetical protein
MDDAERLAWDDAVERATCLHGPAKVEVPSDVLVAIDAEFRPSSDARAVSRPAAMLVVGIVIGSVITAVVMSLMGAS